jgi:phosphoribosylaminoimidazolecarboxamide formyltransferase / IMP cyclohydrolase
MSIRAVKGGVTDKIPVNRIIASTFYKNGLGGLVSGLALECQDEPRVLSSTGTFREVREIIDQLGLSVTLTEVGAYTGAKEMDGGLVKTLHPLVEGGLLGERGNPLHVKYLAEMGGGFIDVAAVNFYPFEEIIAADKTTFEDARDNIDVGGPTMLRAAAKNFLGCVALCDPADYQAFLDHLRENEGCTTLDFRASLAEKVFRMTSHYDEVIADYLADNTVSPEKRALIVQSYLGGE